MIIDLKSMQEQVIPAFKGGEKSAAMRMFVDERNRIMQGRLVPGASIGMHTHETNSEILFVIQGCGHVIDNGETLPVEAGQCHYCRKGHTHSLINDGVSDLVFYACVPEQ